jgi:hypothetical protein
MLSPLVLYRLMKKTLDTKRQSEMSGNLRKHYTHSCECLRRKEAMDERDILFEGLLQLIESGSLLEFRQKFLLRQGRCTVVHGLVEERANNTNERSLHRLCLAFAFYVDLNSLMLRRARGFG